MSIGDTIRALVRAFLADMGKNPGWYSLIAYAAAVFAVETAREHRRLASMARALERDFSERADTIAVRMDRAVIEETDAEYDRASWGEG